MPLYSPDAAAIRERNAGRRRVQQAPGDCHYNTHHNLYQAVLSPHGIFVVVEPRLVEMTEAQFERWLMKVRQVRALARQAQPSTGT
jgi:hypothetical protein